MKVIDFLKYSTQATELCVIRDCGWIVETAWIDHENLFHITKYYHGQTVKGDEWGTLRIVTEHGDKLDVPCHYVDV